MTEHTQEAREARAQAERAELESLPVHHLVTLLINARIALGRKTKQLKRTQARAAQLEQEAGSRFLVSRAARYLSLYVRERDARQAVDTKLRDAQRDLLEAKRTSADAAIKAVSDLIARAGK